MRPKDLAPSVKPKRGRYRKFQERENTTLEWARKTGVRSIAHTLIWSQSTIFRETRRNPCILGGNLSAVPARLIRPTINRIVNLSAPKPQRIWLTKSAHY